MKLLLITPSFYPSYYYGGPIYSTYELAKALKKQGIEIKVITTNANGKEKLKIKTGVFHKLENELPVKYYKSLDSRGTSISMLWNLWSEIKKTDLVYLISIFSPPTPFVVYFCKRFNKPLIISPRGQLGKWCLAQGNPFKKLWLNLFIRPNLDLLVWHTTSEAEQMEIKSVFPSSKTFVVPNGIGLSAFENIELKKDKLFYKKYFDCVNENSKIIVSLGRIHSKKGFDILIEAYKKIQEKINNVFIFIAGKDFGEKSNLLNLISSNNLSDKVFLVGHIEGEEKINFLKNADVFALPSHNENFGMSVVEAMACGCPVVISNKVGIFKEIKENNAGVIVETNTKSVEEGILRLLED